MKTSCGMLLFLFLGAPGEVDEDAEADDEHEGHKGEVPLEILYARHGGHSIGVVSSGLKG